MRRLSQQIAAVLLLGSVAAAQTSGPDVKVENIVPGVAVLFGRGGNIGVSYGPDGVALIDDQFAPATPAILAAVATLTKEPVRFVVNTHWHSDHTGGNENLGKAGAVILAHQNVRQRMSTEQVMEALQRTVPPSPDEALPVVTFTRDVSLHLNGEILRVWHVDDAHTDGDSMIRFAGANVVHTGDVFVNGSYPFVDVSSGGSAAGILAAAEQLLAAVDDGVRIIPGHGPLATKNDLAAYVEMMRTVVGRIRAKLAERVPIAEIVRSKPTAEFDEKWGQGFMTADQFVALAAQSLAPADYPAE